ncbi:hypothetical protein ACEWY4_014698 [Coilia grayii]|uniref:Small integral membrane protein 24 n=1 Tax=Coilia grayii TaxID=363190 RepID=A0ABD1JSZ4_9TELE
MSLRTYVLAGTLLALSISQAQSGGVKEPSSSTTKTRLQPWLVGLAAVVGFLFIVFVVLIVKRIVYGRDEEEDSESFKNHDDSSSDDENEVKQTNL